jgi:hypothetical protein
VTDLVAERLRSATPWLQFGFESKEYSEAVLYLGVALECMVGTERTSDAVKTVGTRCAYLLRQGDGDDRTLSGLRLINQAKGLYGERSRVAHGRYVRNTGWQPKEDGIRQEFEGFVCRVAERFREVGRQEGWQSDADMANWQARLEMA